MLLDARKHPLLERAYARYGRRLLRRAFARVWVGGAPWPEGGGPVIAYVNHSAWWDPVCWRSSCRTTCSGATGTG